MKTAVDSSALLAIFKSEPTASSWMDTLIAARRAGTLVIGDVVYAEVASLFATRADLDDALDKLGIAYEVTTPEASFLAGQTFRAYRLEGGPREHLIPDFLIAAQAQKQADRLAAIDRGYLRRYFSSLTVLSITT